MRNVGIRLADRDKTGILIINSKAGQSDPAGFYG